MTRFELATSGPPDRCATGLRHIPSRRNVLVAIPPLKSIVTFDFVSLPEASAKVLHIFHIRKFFVNFYPISTFIGA